MDANDAEVRIAGSVAIGRELGARRRFWALLLVHTLLTGACIACCVHTLSNLNSPVSNDTSIPDRGARQNGLTSEAVEWSRFKRVFGRVCLCVCLLRAELHRGFSIQPV